MGELIQVYEAGAPAFFRSLSGMIIIAAIFIVGSALIFLLGKKISYNYRTLLAMLSFFFGAIALGNGYFIKMTNTEAGNIELYTNGIQTPQGSAMYSEIKDMYIYVDNEKSLINPTQVIDTKKILLLKLADGKQLELLGAYYPIQEIFNRIEEQVKKE
ncbi:MAG: hypothetical protein AAF705_21015 [Bacteroidota bacterium]